MVELRLRLGTVEGQGVEQVQGTVALADSHEPADGVPFVGWLDLLSVLEKYVDPEAAAGGADA